MYVRIRGHFIDHFNKNNLKLTPISQRKDYNRFGQTLTLIKEGHKSMSDLNRGIMKFEGADSPKLVMVSTVLVLGSIAILIIWALRSAYALG
jgi:hypothetical protein